MNVDKIRDLIYAKCKVYRKEKKNPYPDEHLGVFWQCEKDAYQKTEIIEPTDNLEGSDKEIADSIFNDLIGRMSLKYEGSKEEYDLLLPR